MAIRVLHYCSALNRHGTEMFIMNVFRNTDRKKVTFDFLVHQSDSEGFKKEAEALGANIYTVPPRREGIKKFITALDDFFRNHAQDYAAVHLHGNTLSTLMPLRMALKYGVPIRVAHCHSISARGLHNKILHTLNRLRVHKIANRYLACSEGAKNYGFSHTRALQSATVIPNGIDIGGFRFNSEVRERERAALGIENRLVIGNVAALREGKNHMFMLDIMAEVVKKYPEALLMIVGDGPVRPALENKLRDLGIENNVKLLGSRDDVPSLLQAMDLFLFPSQYEGLGISLIEAQAAGLPILASDVMPGETALTPLIKYMSLQLSAKEWAQQILAMEKRDRSIVYPELQKYDIRETVRLLTSTYLEAT